MESSSVYSHEDGDEYLDFIDVNRRLKTWTVA